MSRKQPEVKITDVDFADDLVLLADNMQEAETLLNLLEETAKTVGLNINEGKKI